MKLFDSLSLDIPYALRGLAKRPGFTIIALLTLALGIGANSAMFSIVYAVLIKPLPFPEQDRIVSVFTTYLDKGVDQDIFSPANFLDLAAQNESFDSIAAINTLNMSMTGVADPKAFAAAEVSPAFFRVLGIKPAAGRIFSSDEAQPGKNRIVILSHSVWQNYFGKDPAVAGKSMLLNGEQWRIVGVLPPGTEYPLGTDLWTPLTFTEQQMASRDSIFLEVIARLKPVLAPATAEAEVRTIAARLARNFPEVNSGMGMTVRPFADQIVGNLRPALLVLLGAVGFVLLIACANLANLLLTNATSRQREFAVRISLGASRPRLMLQLITESILLALIGGALGVVLALWLLPLLKSISPEAVPRIAEASINLPVLVFTLLISSAAGLFFGLTPAFASSRQDLHTSLKEAAAAAGMSRRRKRLGEIIVVAEVSLVLVLLIGAALMLRSFARLRSVNPGFRPGNLLSLQVSLPDTRYSERSSRIHFARELLERLRGSHAIASAGAASPGPFGVETIINDVGGYHIEGRSEVYFYTDFTRITPGYLETMAISLKLGRNFSDADHESAPLVALVNETLARRCFGTQNPIGQRLVFGKAEPVIFEIVGVVGDVKHNSLNAPVRPEIYIPYLQRPNFHLNIFLRVRTNTDDAIAAFKSTIRALDRDLPVETYASLEDLMERSLAPSRASTALLSGFASLAFVLAMVGLYGVLAYSVSRRTQEIGIRMVLGARKTDVWKLIVAQGMTVTLIGIAAGLVASIALTRFLKSLLFEITHTNAEAYIGVSILVIAVALIACYVPARRAMRVHPASALKYE